MLESMLNNKFNHEDFQLKPWHRVLAQHVFVNDALPNRILAGTVKVKNDIDRFTENGVVFRGDNQETPCDVVLLATGYKVVFPFISEDVLPVVDNKVNLYKWVFAADLKHPKTLAFISLIQPIGAILPIGEQQSRWFAQLMANKVTLPDRQTMKRDIEKKRQEIAKRYYQSERHTIQVDFIPYMDELAQQYGVKPNLFKYFFTDHQLWKALVFGPCVPYQYRLEGPHRWSGARDAILSVEDRIAAPLKTRFVGSEELVENKTKSQDRKSIDRGKLLFYVAIGLISYFLYQFVFNYQ